MIFETLLTYDYLARPAKLVPLTAEALPEITDNGRTYTFRLKKGIYFTPDPAFKGAKRELVADDYVYSLKRLMDPKIRSPWTWLVDGKIVGLDELAAKAKEMGSFDYAAKMPGPRGGRPLHAADPAEAARLQPFLRPRARADQRGGARSGRGLRRHGRTHDVEPGRHRTVQARVVDPLVEDRPRSQSGLPRLRLGLQGGRRPRRRARSSPR